jgi:hypothetical protein
MDPTKNTSGHVTPNFYFYIRWDLRSTSGGICDLHITPKKKRVGTRYTISSCVFASGAICGSHGAFLCARGVKCQHTIFMLVWAPCGSNKNYTGTHHTKPVFFHLVSHSAF